MLTRFFLQAPAQLLTALFFLLLQLAQALQLFLKGGQCRFTLHLFQSQALQFLTTGQYPALGIAGPANPQEIPANPVTVATDQAFAGLQAATQGQCRVEILDGFDLCQPGRQIERAFDLFEQAARLSHAILARAYQAQVALGEPGQVETGEVIDQYRLQVGTEYRFHRQFPTGFHPQPFSQSRTLLQPLLGQPLGRPGAWVERCLLQGFK
ncbi:hypothetical protein D3C80_859280 [compost metagenome]